MSWLIPILGRLIFGGLDWYLKKHQYDESLRKSYIEFLEQVEKKGDVKVANFLAIQQSEEELAEQIRKKRLTPDE